MITFAIGSYVAILLAIFCCAFVFAAIKTTLPLLKKGLLFCAAFAAILFVVAAMAPKTASKAQSAPTATASDGSVPVKLD